MKIHGRENEATGSLAHTQREYCYSIRLGDQDRSGFQDGWLGESGRSKDHASKDLQKENSTPGVKCPQLTFAEHK